MEVPYDESGLQSLIGYGRTTHLRSGGICQLCGCGAGREIDFDLWRQFTIEHLIGQGQGGYPPQIKVAVDVRFGHLSAEQRTELAGHIHDANVVTACHFCNSTTSRNTAMFTMTEAIAALPDDPEEALAVLREKLQAVLVAKRKQCNWKLRSVYRAFKDEIRPELVKRREDDPALRQSRDLSALDVTASNDPHTYDAHS